VPRKHVSVQKRHRQSLVRNRGNRAVKSKIRKTVKAFDTATTDAKESALREAISVADKAVAKRVIHKNKASRMKSRMSRKVGASATKSGK